MLHRPFQRLLKSLPLSLVQHNTIRKRLIRSSYTHVQQKLTDIFMACPRRILQQLFDLRLARTSIRSVFDELGVPIMNSLPR